MQQLGLAYTPKTQSRLRELLWPAVDNPVAIKTVCHTGMWVSFVVGGRTALFTIIGGHLLGGFVTGAIFVAIGIGIRKYSRVAAILGVLLYLGPQIATASISVVSVIFAFLFISSLRATFALHRLNKQSSIPLQMSRPSSETGISIESGLDSSGSL